MSVCAHSKYPATKETGWGRQKKNWTSERVEELERKKKRIGYRIQNEYR